MEFKKKEYDAEDIHRILGDAWLNIDVRDNELFNPLAEIPSDLEDDPHLYITWLLSRPEYFSFICKELLNVKIIPTQAVILEEMWNRKFPMLIASRGFGKATRLDTPILTDKGWVNMGDICIGSKVYGRDGELHSVTAIHPHKNKQVCLITMLDGRTIECCEDHLWVVKNQKKEIVISTKEMFGKGIKYNKSASGGVVYKYKIPNCKPIQFAGTEPLTIDPYLLGCLLGDGCMTTLTPKIASDDDFIINQFRDKLVGFELKKDPTNNNYTIVDRNKEFSTVIRKSTGKSFQQRSRNRLTQQIKSMGLNVGCKDKFIPYEYKCSSVENRMEIVRGLLDTDGSINARGAIEFTNTCERLVDDLISILRSLGITCKKTIDDRSDQMMTLPQGTIINRTPYFRVFINTSLSVFKLPRKLDRIKTKKTSGEEYSAITNIEYLDEYVDMQCITVDSPDHTYITKDYIVTHNSFMLGVYALLRTLLMPKRKVVIAGDAFRQSKVIYEYMEAIWNNAPLLRSLVGTTGLVGPKRDVDMCKFHIFDNVTMAIPIGDGCGLGRTHITYSDKFGTLNREGDYSPKRDISIYGNGQFNNSDEAYYNGIKPIKRVVTKKGFEFGGTYNHKLKVLRNQNIEWCRLDEIEKGDSILIDRSYRWHDGDFSCTNDEAYTLGAMIGDGCWTGRNSLGFATKDEEFISRLNAGFVKNFAVCNDGVHYNLYSVEEQQDWLDFWGMEKCYTIDKALPENILSAPREQMTECLRGLFDTDGYVFVQEAKGGLTVSVGFTNTSKVLVEQIQYILLHYGIISRVGHRDRNEKWHTAHELLITGKDVKIFCSEIGFYLNRKQDMLEDGISRQKRDVSMGDVIPGIKDEMIRIAKTNKVSGMSHIGASKIADRKNMTRDYISDFLLKYGDIDDLFIATLTNLNNPDVYYDTVESVVNEEPQKTYDVHIPTTHEYCAGGFYSHNTKIRGLRANDLLVDEFGSVPREIFETVLSGFAAVKSEPTESVIIEAYKHKAREMAALLKEHNIDFAEDLEDDAIRDNQIVISGTAYYDFNHFSEYHKRWHSIIESKGDRRKLAQIVGEDDADDVEAEKYSIIRIPYEMIPRGFMDAGQVARAKATATVGTYEMEYGAVFSKDSAGFFKMSLIEQCVVSHTNILEFPSGPAMFHPVLTGDPNSKYVFGVDPASEVDNFTIIVLELKPDHKRIVHCWSTNREEHKKKIKAGLINEVDFYSYTAKKIRELMSKFPCAGIAMDAQGGGIAVMEALHDPDKYDAAGGEQPIWPSIDPAKEKDTDGEIGLHIVDLIQFADAKWTSEANHGLRKDFEDKVTIFPFFDSVTIGLSIEDDKALGRMYDTLEDSIMEIEELKNELAMISMTELPSGKDKWDTPEVKKPGGKKGRLRKDRYSALIMANMLARTIHRTATPTPYKAVGGYAQTYSGGKVEGPICTGPAWYTEHMKKINY